MARIVLFHHVRGLTDGLRAIAADLETDGHEVHLPDSFDGRTFDSIEAGFAHLETIDPEVRAAAADAAVADREDLVVIGFSLGVMAAQRIAQTRPGVRAAVLFDACVPLGADGFGPWPDGVAVQVHGKDDDEFFAHEGDLDAARDLVATVGDRAELHVYPGDQHLFADRSLETYDEESAALALDRARAFVAEF